MSTPKEQRAFEDVITEAWLISSDPPTTEEILKAGRENPLSDDESRRLLTSIVKQLLQSAQKRNDVKALEKMPKTDEEIAAYVEEMIESRKRKIR